MPSSVLLSFVVVVGVIVIPFNVAILSDVALQYRLIVRRSCSTPRYLPVLGSSARVIVVVRANVASSFIASIARAAST